MKQAARLRIRRMLPEMALLAAFIGQVASLLWTRSHMNVDRVERFLSDILGMPAFWYPEGHDPTLYMQFLGNLRDFMLAQSFFLSMGMVVLLVQGITRKKKAVCIATAGYGLLFLAVVVPWLCGMFVHRYCKTLYISVSFFCADNLLGMALYFVEALVICFLFGLKIKEWLSMEPLP